MADSLLWMCLRKGINGSSQLPWRISLRKRTWVHPHVTFKGTQVPVLDQAPLLFTVKPLSLYQLTLTCNEFMPNLLLDTSMGTLAYSVPKGLPGDWMEVSIDLLVFAVSGSEPCSCLSTDVVTVFGRLGPQRLCSSYCLFLAVQDTWLMFGYSSSLDLDLPNMSKFTCFLIA